MIVYKYIYIYLGEKDEKKKEKCLDVRVRRPLARHASLAAHFSPIYMYIYI